MYFRGIYEGKGCPIINFSLWLAMSQGEKRRAYYPERNWKEFQILIPWLSNLLAQEGSSLTSLNGIFE